MRVLDIAITKSGKIVLITQVSEHPYNDNPPTATVEFIGPGGEKVAWYYEEELNIIDSLPMVLARMGTSPGSSGFTIPKDYFTGRVKCTDEDMEADEDD